MGIDFSSDPVWKQIMFVMALENKTDDTVLKEIIEEGEKVEKHLNGTTADNEQLMKDFMNLTNLFRKYTRQNDTALSLRDKLLLQSLYVNITDEIKIKMVERIGVRDKERQEAQMQQGWGSWMLQGAASTAAYAASYWYGSSPQGTTEEDFVRQIDEFQKAIENPELEMSLSRVKSLLATALEEDQRPEDAQRVESMDIKEVLEILEALHAEKQQMARELAAQVFQEPRSTIDQAYELLYGAAKTIADTTSAAAAAVSDGVVAAAGAAAAGVSAAAGAVAAGVSDAATAVGGAVAPAVQMASDAALIAGEAIAGASAAIAEGVVAAVEAGQQMAIDYKDDQVRAAVQPLKPDSIFKGKSFQEVVADIVEKKLENRHLDLPGVTQVAQGVAETYRQNLADNMRAFEDNRNTARLAVKFNTSLMTVLKAEKGPPPPSEEELVRRLSGDSTMTVEKFREQAKERIVTSIGKMITKDAEAPSEEAKGIGKILWEKIKRGLKKFTNLFSNRAAKKVANKGISKAAEKMEKAKFDKAEWAAQLMGVESPLKQFENHSDIIMEHLIAELTEEMATIVKESSQSRRSGGDVNVSGYASDAAAFDAFKMSAVSLGNELVALQPEGATLVQQALWGAVGTLGGFVASQQGGGGLLDFGGPVYKELVPAWNKWLTAPPQ